MILQMNIEKMHFQQKDTKRAVKIKFIRLQDVFSLL